MQRREFLSTAGGSAGGVAVAVAGAAGSGAAQEGTSHTVEMTDGLTFEPAEIIVAPGDTVVWENVGSVGHTVTAYEDDIPDGAEYWASGGFDSESAARGGYPPDGDIPGGESYQHTFETVGDHEYFCIPHEGAGMTGTVVVQEGGAPAEGGGQMDPAEMGVPFRAHFVGIATILAVIVSLVYTFYVLKYGESAHATSPNRR